MCSTKSTHVKLDTSIQRLIHTEYLQFGIKVTPRLTHSHNIDSYLFKQKDAVQYILYLLFSFEICWLVTAFLCKIIF